VGPSQVSNRADTLCRNPPRFRMPPLSSFCSSRAHATQLHVARAPVTLAHLEILVGGKNYRPASPLRRKESGSQRCYKIAHSLASRDCERRQAPRGVPPPQSEERSCRDLIDCPERADATTRLFRHQPEPIVGFGWCVAKPIAFFFLFWTGDTSGCSTRIVLSPIS